MRSWYVFPKIGNESNLCGLLLVRFVVISYQKCNKFIYHLFFVYLFFCPFRLKNLYQIFPFIYHNMSSNVLEFDLFEDFKESLKKQKEKNTIPFFDLFLRIKSWWKSKKRRRNERNIEKQDSDGKFRFIIAVDYFLFNNW